MLKTIKAPSLYAFILMLATSGCAATDSINLTAPGLVDEQTGRMFLVFSKVEQEAEQESEEGSEEVLFSRSNEEEPRFSIGWPLARSTAAPFFAMDLENWDGEETLFESSASYPFQSLDELPSGVWNVQALFDSNSVLSDINSEGNFYSIPQRIEITGEEVNLNLSLSEVIPEEAMPEDTELLKFVKIRSELLSDFYQEDIYLRASVLLPRAYDADKQYPVLYQIGGLNDRYTRSQELIEEEDFRSYWVSEEAAEVIIVFLDGESPWGDSYQVNSAVSGPYADANFQELFPYLEQQYSISNSPDYRFTSGCSTGGWVSMALQVFYPDYFNGAYSFSPDSPSFSAFQLIDLYQDDNAFINEHGMLRPSMRETDGEPMFTVADEIQAEGAMGLADNFLNSGQQWATWNVVYGQLDESGDPVPVWNQLTGEIDKAAVEAWSRWDINKHVEENWQELGPKLQGKLHFWMGDMDNFYLNVGLRLLEQTLSEQVNPVSDAAFTWEPNYGHCEIDNRTYYIEVIENLIQKVES